MQSELRRILEECGVTTFFVTHDQEEAMTLSDSIVVMNHGIIEQTGSPYEVYERPRNRFVASFLGKANFFGGKVLAVDGNRVTMETPGGTFTISAPSAQVGETVSYAVRPEKIEMSIQGDGVRGIVTSVVYSGSTTSFRVRCGGMEVLTEERSAAGQSAFARGDSVVLHWPADAAIPLED